ncbi:MAG: uracil-DNA glycosylase [Sedimenticola sp.]|nr:uracil-DNA glycosylase [Sedimenticola sp.]
MRHQYLQAMGIQDWVPRMPAAGERVRAAVVEDQAAPVDVHPQIPGAPAGTDAPPPRSDEPPAWLEEAPPISDDFVPASDLDPDAESIPRPAQDDVGRLDWPRLEARVADCDACELHRSRTRTVFGSGSREADLMVIGEAPGADEDRKGEPFVGRAGQLLGAMLAAIGLAREQVYIANILKCRPPGNRDPRADEVVKCHAYLQRQVALVRPKVIVAVGAVAARNLLQRDEPVGRLRGQAHQYRGIPLVVSYHPAYLLRSPEQKAKAWMDLQKAARLIR